MLPEQPEVLLSYCNAKLRDFYPSLDALCDDLEVDRTALEARLRAAGFVYDGARNAFVGEEGK